MVMSTTEYEQKNTQADWEEDPSLHNISWNVDNKWEGMKSYTNLSGAEGPVVVDHVQHGERHGEHTQQDVGHSDVGNQDVPGRLQQLSKIWKSLQKFWFQKNFKNSSSLFIVHVISCRIVISNDLHVLYSVVTELVLFTKYIISITLFLMHAVMM